MKKRIKKLLALALATGMLLSMVGCTTDGTKKADGGSTDTSSQSGGDSSGKKIGIALPTKEIQRWNQDGDNMKAGFEEAGYTTDIQFANNDIATQVNQIENMISNGCSALIISAIDGTSLSEVLDKAKQANIPVIAYDRLIMNSDAITNYATFDNYKVGEMQGQYIEEKLDLKNTDGPYNIELFTGSSDDNNVKFFFGGAMEILQPYIDSGKLVVKSGTDTTLAACATPNWSTEEAQKRMENIITKSYSDGTKLDAVLASNDSVANGVTNALTAAGYTADDFPILTGMDCEITSVKNIIKGVQSMSIFKDTRQLATQVIQMTQDILAGKEAEVNDTESYDNGNGIVPTYLCNPEFVDKDNYQEKLVDSGYYTEDQLK